MVLQKIPLVSILFGAGVKLWTVNSDHYLFLSSAVLEKEHKDKDEKISKMKAVAIKAKKELDVSKKEVE